MREEVKREQKIYIVTGETKQGDISEVGITSIADCST